MSKPEIKPSTQVTITTTATHVHQFMEIWRQGQHKTSPFSKSNPLALALFEQTGLPIQVYCEYFTLHGETITLEGLPEDVRAFVGSVSGALREMGWDGWKDDGKCAKGLETLLALVPFRFEFDTMGLGTDALAQTRERVLEHHEDSDSESESVFRQEAEAQSEASSPLPTTELWLSPQPAQLTPSSLWSPWPSSAPDWGAFDTASLAAAMAKITEEAGHFVSSCCRQEKCRVCGRQATHKLGEEIFPDDPSNRPQWEVAGLAEPRTDKPFDNIATGRHNLTAYVCCRHFSQIVGPAALCFAESRDMISDPSLEKLLLSTCFAFRRFLDNVSYGPKPTDDTSLEAAQWTAVNTLEAEATLWCYDALRALGVDPSNDPRLELDPDNPLMEIGDGLVDTFRSVVAEIYGADKADVVAELFRSRTVRKERQDDHA